MKSAGVKADLLPRFYLLGTEYSRDIRVSLSFEGDRRPLCNQQRSRSTRALCIIIFNQGYNGHISISVCSKPCQGCKDDTVLQCKSSYLQWTKEVRVGKRFSRHCIPKGGKWSHTSHVPLYVYRLYGISLKLYLFKGDNVTYWPHYECTTTDNYMNILYINISFLNVDLCMELKAWNGTCIFLWF